MTTLTDLINSHNKSQARLREANSKKKQKLKQSFGKVTESLVVEVNKKVVEVFSNQQRIENETKNLHSATDKMVSQTSKWLQLFQQLNDGLKELGDIENWSEQISMEVGEIVNTIDRVVVKSNSSINQ